MRATLAVLLIGLLVLSLGLNVYLWFALNQSDSISHLPTSMHTENSTAAAIPPEMHNNSGETSWQTNVAATTRQVNEKQWMQTLLNDGDYEQLSQYLTEQLKASPFDESLLLMEAELIKLTKPLPTALVHYYDLLELPLSLEAQEDIRAKVALLYQQAQVQLSKEAQWELVAMLNEPLFQRLPDVRLFALNLAEAYAHQQKLTLMEDALAALPSFDAQAEAIRDLAYATNNQEPEQASPFETPSMQGSEKRIALTRVGDQYRVQAKALNQQAVMILDTGATTTAISSRLYARLGRTRRLTFLGNFNVGTASGTIEAPLVQIPRFYFAGYEFENVSAIVLPEAALPDTDGLLGMNVLGEFDFSIRPQSSELWLSKR